MVIVTVMSGWPVLGLVYTWQGQSLDLGFSPPITVIELTGWAWISPTLLFHLSSMTVKKRSEVYRIVSFTVNSVLVVNWHLRQLVWHIIAKQNQCKHTKLYYHPKVTTTLHISYFFSFIFSLFSCLTLSDWGFSTPRPTLKSWTSLCRCVCF